IPIPQQRATLPSRQNVQPTNRNLGRRHRGLQQPNQPPRQRLYARALEQVGSIVEPQLQPLARRHHQAQRPRPRTAPAPAATPETPTSGRRAAALDRVVLKHHQAVEQRPRSGQLLDLGQPKMLVRNQSRLAVLHLFKKLQQRLRRRQLHPQRQRVDEQPHHALDAGNLRRPPRHRHPDHNLVPPAHTAEQEPPRRLHEGIERQTMPARLRAQRRAQTLAQRKRDLLGRNRRPTAIGRRHTRGLLHPRQSLLPSRARPGAILRRQPGQIVTVGRHSPQPPATPLVLKEGKHPPPQPGQRPPTNQQMGVGEPQPMPLRRKPDQRKAHQRRTAKIKALDAILPQLTRQALRAARFIQQRQINPPPARPHRRNNDLHRTAQPRMPKAGAQARMAQKQRLNRSFQRLALEPPLKPQLQLHRIAARRLRIIKRVEQQPLLQRRQRQHILNLRVLALQPFDLALRERHQRQIARAAPARRGQSRMANKPLQRQKPALRQIANLRLRHNRRRPRPVRRQLGSLRPIKRERIDLKAVRKRHGRIAPIPQLHSLSRPTPVRTRRPRKPPEIVEANLRRRKAAKLQSRLRVQIAQQPIAKPVARHRAQLLLDQLERTPKPRTPRQGLLNINPAHIQPHRVEAGEPAHRARQINIRPHLLAPVTLNIDHHPSAGATTTAPTPLRKGQSKPSEQHMVDAAMERRRNPRQQRLRERNRQREREPTRRAQGVARRIERAIHQRQRGRAQLPSQNRKHANARRILRPRRKPLRPPPKRAPPRRQRRHLPARNRRPRRRKLRHQDAPRHPVNRKMMDAQQQTARPLRAGIKPHRLHHLPSRRRKPALRRARLLADARLTRPSIKITNVDPSDARRRTHRPNRRHLQLPLPLPRLVQPQTQRIVMIKHSLQRQNQISLAQPRRHLQQHRLIEATEPTPALQKPAHDRRRRQSASGNVRRARRLSDNAGDPGQPRNSLMLKHRTRRDHQPGLARSAHQL